MVYIGSGTKIIDPTFLQIKAVLQQGQKQLDISTAYFQEATKPSLSGPVLVQPHPDNVRSPANGWASEAYGEKIKKIRRDTLRDVLVLVTLELNNSK